MMYLKFQDSVFSLLVATLFNRHFIFKKTKKIPKAFVSATLFTNQQRIEMHAFPGCVLFLH